MVVINIAYSAPVNAPGSGDSLTHEQLWKGMQRKVRHGNEFVPAITKCEVQKENADGSEIVRHVVFKPGFGIRPEVTERCVLKEPCKTEFYQDDGSFVQNIISNGADGALYLTYTFEWVRKDVEKGTPAYDEAVATYQKTSKMAVESSLVVVREMVKDGRIA